MQSLGPQFFSGARPIRRKTSVRLREHMVPITFFRHVSVENVQPDDGNDSLIREVGHWGAGDISEC